MIVLTPELIEELAKTTNGFYSWDYVSQLANRVIELEEELNGVVSDLTLQASGYDRRPQTPTVSEKSINFIPPKSEGE